MWKNQSRLELRTRRHRRTVVGTRTIVNVLIKDCVHVRRHTRFTNLDRGRCVTRVDFCTHWNIGVENVSVPYAVHYFTRHASENNSVQQAVLLHVPRKCARMNEITN